MNLRKLKFSLVGILSALGTVVLSSCTNEAPVYEDDMVDVAFSVNIEDALNFSSRADTDAEGPGKLQNIGRGRNIDMLIYAVYMVEQKDENSPMQFTLLTQYASTTENKFDSSTPAMKDGKAHEGQTIVSLQEGQFNNGGFYHIRLRLMRNQRYCIALWAQSSQTEAYDTDDLMSVIVNYKGINNDENRDAFCKAEYFSVSSQADADNRTITLTRPFAQINMGSTQDFFNKNFSKVKYSKISLTGAANKLNVITDKISTVGADGKETTTPLKIEYDWEIIPYDKFLNESLFVDLKNTGEFSEFKYLSMSYVLVPAQTVPNGDSYVYTSSVLSDVTIGLSESIRGTNPETLELPNVPVHRNCRTNILSGVGTGDAEKINLSVSFDKGYNGDNNNY